MIYPLGYLDMTWLVHNASAVFTDTEAYFHPMPGVRDETEWVEPIEAGWNRLWTTPDYRTRRDIADYGETRCDKNRPDDLNVILGRPRHET